MLHIYKAHQAVEPRLLKEFRICSNDFPCWILDFSLMSWWDIQTDLVIECWTKQGLTSSNFYTSWTSRGSLCEHQFADAGPLCTSPTSPRLLQNHHLVVHPRGLCTQRCGRRKRREGRLHVHTLHYCWWMERWTARRRVRWLLHLLRKTATTLPLHYFTNRTEQSLSA